MYVYNDRRRKIWAGFTRYCNKLRTVAELDILHVDGGFVTNKVEPKDVDIVISFPDMATFVRLATAHRFLRDADYVKSGFYVDMLHWMPVLPPGADDLIEYFQTLRLKDAIERGVPPNTRKGILRVSIRA